MQTMKTRDEERSYMAAKERQYEQKLAALKLDYERRTRNLEQLVQSPVTVSQPNSNSSAGGERNARPSPSPESKKVGEGVRWAGTCVHPLARAVPSRVCPARLY